jgi:hypothetical protein
VLPCHCPPVDLSLAPMRMPHDKGSFRSWRRRWHCRLRVTPHCDMCEGCYQGKGDGACSCEYHMVSPAGIPRHHLQATLRHETHSSKDVVSQCVTVCITGPFIEYFFEMCTGSSSFAEHMNVKKYCHLYAHAYAHSE